MITMDELISASEQVYTEYDSLPISLRQAVLAGKGADGVSLLKNGKDWAFEFVKKYQPRTANVLMNGGDFVLICRDSWVGPVINTVFEVSGRVVEVVRQRYGFNPSDEGSAKNRYAWQRSLSLPAPLRQAYYYRMDGMNIPTNVGIGPFSRVLPYPITRPWQSIDGYLNELGLKKKLIPIIEELIPGIAPDRKGGSYTNFMMFLNSRGSFAGYDKKDGDSLFVKNHIQDEIVYYIRDADVKNISIIADPSEAVDRYCEHVLLGKEERFDFRSWAVPL